MFSTGQKNNPFSILISYRSNMELFVNDLKLDLWCCQQLLYVGQPTDTKKKPIHHRKGITNKQESCSENSQLVKL